MTAGRPYARRRTTGPPGPSPLFFRGFVNSFREWCAVSRNGLSGAPSETRRSVPDSPDRLRSDYRWKTISYCVPPSRLGLKHGLVLLSPPHGVHPRRQPARPFGSRSRRCYGFRSVAWPSNRRRLPNAVAAPAARAPCFHRFRGERILSVGAALKGRALFAYDLSVGR